MQVKNYGGVVVSVYWCRCTFESFGSRTENALTCDTVLLIRYAALQRERLTPAVAAARVVVLLMVFV